MENYNLIVSIIWESGRLSFQTMGKTSNKSFDWNKLRGKYPISKKSHMDGQFARTRAWSDERRRQHACVDGLGPSLVTLIHKLIQLSYI